MTDRKQQHIDLALLSSMAGRETDQRFWYEPLLASHPQGEAEGIPFLGRTLRMPMWVSSMTGGTANAGVLNHTIARICSEFGIGMSLGSCRRLLDDDSWFGQYNLRPVLGDSLPFYANLGIAQVERMLAEKSVDKIARLTGRLRADGIVVHINPLQEWMQPEGNRITVPPLQTLERLLEVLPVPVIVKEVGQGMGPESLRALFALPLAAIEFGAWGGTNFFEVERRRAGISGTDALAPIASIGHSAAEMVEIVNGIIEKNPEYAKREVIISGGVGNFLDGYYLVNRCKARAIYGQAAGVLRLALAGEQQLRDYIGAQVKGFRLAQQYLRIREV